MKKLAVALLLTPALLCASESGSRRDSISSTHSHKQLEMLPNGSAVYRVTDEDQEEESFEVVPGKWTFNKRTLERCESVSSGLDQLSTNQSAPLRRSQSFADFGRVEGLARGTIFTPSEVGENGLSGIFHMKDGLPQIKKGPQTESVSVHVPQNQNPSALSRAAHQAQITFDAGTETASSLASSASQTLQQARESHLGRVTERRLYEYVFYPVVGLLRPLRDATGDMALAVSTAVRANLAAGLIVLAQSIHPREQDNSLPASSSSAPESQPTARDDV